LQDNDQAIKAKVLPTICSLVSKFPDDKKLELLNSLIKPKIEEFKSMKNQRDSLITMLEQLFTIF
jgi:hypothetical protein